MWYLLYIHVIIIIRWARDAVASDGNAHNKNCVYGKGVL